MKKRLLQLCILLFLLFSLSSLNAQRHMENLGRGVVAIRSGAGQVFINWRILGTEFNNGTTYNLYKAGTLIASNLSVSNFTDNTATNSTYTVSAIIKGAEQPQSPAVGVTTNPYLEVALQNIGDYYVHLAWVGDLDGDGEYDFVVDRVPNVAGLTTKVEAYKRDGTFLWRVDLGPLSLNRDGIEGGAATISNGMWDGLTVYDLDNDGKAEVALKTANGTILGDGKVVNFTDTIGNFVSVLNGMTGSELARIQLPIDYYSDGPLQTQFNIGYLDGINPSIIVKAKNRQNNGNFNLVVTAYDYIPGKLTQRWKFKPGSTLCSDYHQQRIADIDGDGKDEIVDGGYAIDDNGTLLYTLSTSGVFHGDRFHIGDFDPSRPGLEGYGIQQDNPSGLAWYYYDAKDGKILNSQTLPTIGDYARGNVADLDPRYPGYEMWTFTDGIYNVSGKKTSSAIPASYPNFRLWWDGDLLSEMLDGTKFNKWDYKNSVETRMMDAGSYGAVTTWRTAPVFYGDILGDWREEVVYEKSDHSELMIFTTTIPTNNRIYTLAHDPEYRLCMTTKGYYQSAQLDYYLGDGMATPPVPPMQQAKTRWKGGLTGDTWDTTTSNWMVNSTKGAYTQGDEVMFDISGKTDTIINIPAPVSPSYIKVISPVNYSFNGLGNITGNAGILKAGNGSLNLNIPCDYTDTTRIEQGIINVNANLSQSPVLVYFGATLGGTGTISKTVSLNNGAIIAPGKQNSVGTLNFGNGLKLSSQSICQFDITNDSTGLAKPSDKISITGDFTLPDTTTFRINKINGIVKAGKYPLVTYTGTFTGNLKKINITGLFGQKIALKDSMKTIWLEVIASRTACEIVWSGVNKNWDLLTSASWLNNDMPDIFANGDSVIFNETGKANSTINLVGELPIGKMTVQTTSTTNYTISGSGIIGGTGGITKNGPGVLTLSNTANKYTGNTEINDGSVVVAGFANAGLTSSIGASTSVDPSNIVFNNTKVRYLTSADNNSDRGMTFAGVQDTLEIGTTGKTLTLAGVLAGSAKLVKTGTGNLYLTNNNNTYTGGTVIKSGTIQINDPGNNLVINALGTGPVTFEGGTLSMGNTSNYTTCNMNFVVPFGKSGTLNTDQRCSYYGTLTGAGNLNLSLPGTIDRTIFFGDWSGFTGIINATGTRLRLSNASGLPNATLMLGSGLTAYYSTGTSGGDTNAQTVSIGAVVSSSGSFLVDENWIIGSKNTNSTCDGTISGNSITKVGTGGLTITAANTYSGGTTINGGSITVNNTSGSGLGTGTVSVNSGGTLAGTGIVSGTILVNSGGVLSPASSIVGTLNAKNVNVYSNGILAIDIDKKNGRNDLLNLSGTLTMNGKLQVTALNGTTFTAGDSIKIIKGTINGKPVEISPSTPGDGLVWDLSAFNTAGALKVAVATGLDDLSFSTRIYPNPFKNSIHLQFEQNMAEVQISVVSILGNVILNNKFYNTHQINLNLDHLENGIYLLHIKEGNNLMIQKILKE